MLQLCDMQCAVASDTSEILNVRGAKVLGRTLFSTQTYHRPLESSSFATSATRIIASSWFWLEALLCVPDALMIGMLIASFGLLTPSPKKRPLMHAVAHCFQIPVRVDTNTDEANWPWLTAFHWCRRCSQQTKAGHQIQSSALGARLVFHQHMQAG